MYLTLKAIFAFRAIHRFAFLYRTLDFTHNLEKNLFQRHFSRKAYSHDHTIKYGLKIPFPCLQRREI